MKQIRKERNGESGSVFSKHSYGDWAWSILAALTLVSGVIGNIILN